MKFYLYDHINTHSYELKKIFDKAANISKEIDREENDKADFKNANLVIGHYEDDDIEDIINFKSDFNEFPDNQVVVFITTQQGFPENENFKNTVVTCKGKRRAVLFVRNMKALSNDETLRKLVKLTFEQAKEVIERKDDIFNRESHPFNPFTSEHLQAIFILCRIFAAVSIAAGEISFEDALKHIFVEVDTDRLKRLFKDLVPEEKDETGYWKLKLLELKNTNWHLDIFKKEDFDTIKREFGETEYKESQLERFIHSIIRKKTIDDNFLLDVLKVNREIEERLNIERQNKTSAQWQIRNRAFRHDWLQYFLEDIKAFVNTNCRDFSLMDKRFQDWEMGKRNEAKTLIDQYKEEMDPRKYFETYPLNQLVKETRQWMKGLVNAFWKIGCPGYIYKRIIEAVYAFKEADTVYKRISNQAISEVNKSDFQDLKETFHRLSEMFRNLEI